MAVATGPTTGSCTRPTGIQLPTQGWKIHASACLDNAEQILEPIWEYCVRERIAFKFIRSRELLFLRNMKYAARGYSGKFVTIFPADEQQLERILARARRRCSTATRARTSSATCAGATARSTCATAAFASATASAANGELEAAIEDGERRAHPRPPRRRRSSCRRASSCPRASSRTSRRATAPRSDDLPYRLERALHFSNGGGVYAGVDTRSGEQVVLKEARPHAGLGTRRARRGRAPADASATRCSSSRGSASRPLCATTSTPADTTSSSMDFIDGPAAERAASSTATR